MLKKLTLYEEYILEKNSIPIISKKYGVSKTMVYNRLKKYGIPIRKIHTKNFRKKMIKTWNKKISEGYVSPIKGKKLSKEARKNMSEAHIGFKMSKETKNKISEGNKGKVRSREAKERISKIKKDLFKDKENHPFFGRTLTEEHRKKISKSIKEFWSKNPHPFEGRHHTEETKEKIRLNHIGKFVGEKNPNYGNGDKIRGEKNPFFGKKHSKESKNKMSISTKEKFKDKNFLTKYKKAMEVKPNKCEQILINLFQKQNIPYKYVGDFSFWIDGRNPDFYNGENKIIELFGDYWHSDELLNNIGRTKSNEPNTKKHYSKYGYKTLVIWERELKDMDKVLEKIKEFDNEDTNTFTEKD